MVVLLTRRLKRLKRSFGASSASYPAGVTGFVCRTNTLLDSMPGNEGENPPRYPGEI